jgi:IMP cyclohydrolase
MKASKHLINYSFKVRDYLTIELCESVVHNPLRIELQLDGRKRYWGYIEKYNKYLRVVVDKDGETILTAHFDRNFKI